MDDLENASNLPAYGSKMGIDATRKWPGEGFTREWPKRLTTTEARAGRPDGPVEIDHEGQNDGCATRRSHREGRSGDRLTDETLPRSVRAGTSSCWDACEHRAT